MATQQPPGPPVLVVHTAGHRTTEFWLAVVTTIGNLAGALSGELAPRYAAIASAVTAAAYAVARGLAKRPAI